MRPGGGDGRATVALEHLGVDVQHHLVAVAAGAGVELGGEGGLGDDGDGVGAALAGGGVVGAALLLAGDVVELLLGGVEGAQEGLAGLRLEAAAEDEHAVVVPVGGEVAALAAELVAGGLGLAVDLAPGAHQLLDVEGGAVAGAVEEVGLVLGGGDAGEGADLRVGDLAAGEGGGEQRQGRQGAGHPHLLAGGAEGEAGAPVEPVGAGAEADAPALALVELLEQHEQLVGRRLDVGREPGDAFAEGLERLGGGRPRAAGLRDDRVRRAHGGGRSEGGNGDVERHRRSSRRNRWFDCKPRFSSHLKGCCPPFREVANGPGRRAVRSAAFGVAEASQERPERRLAGTGD